MKRRLAVVMMTGGLILGCSNPEAPSPEPASTPPVMLGDVDVAQPLRALGTEPFWSLQIADETLIYESPGVAEQRFRLTGREPGGTIIRIMGEGDGGRTIAVDLVQTACSDGMSDREYPLTAFVVIRSGQDDSPALNGCAASVTWLETQPAP